MLWPARLWTGVWWVCLEQGQPTCGMDSLCVVSSRLGREGGQSGTGGVGGGLIHGTSTKKVSPRCHTWPINPCLDLRAGASITAIIILNIFLSV